MLTQKHFKFAKLFVMILLLCFKTQGHQFFYFVKSCLFWMKILWVIGGTSEGLTMEWFWLAPNGSPENGFFAKFYGFPQSFKIFRKPHFDCFHGSKLCFCISLWHMGHKKSLMHLCARFHSGFGLIFCFYGATFRKKFFIMKMWKLILFLLILALGCTP